MLQKRRRKAFLRRFFASFGAVGAQTMRFPKVPKACESVLADGSTNSSEVL